MKNCKKLDMQNYNRLQHFKYFSTMAYPYVGVTENVDITSFLKFTKENGYSFFLSILWCAAQAANNISQLRQRIFEDGIVEFDNCETSHTVLKDDGTYCYCTLDCNMPYTQFLKYAQDKQAKARKNGTIEESAEDSLSYLFVSTLPWISYTALVQPVASANDSNPRITWGKYYNENEKTLMPLTLLCHHALIDGKHIGDFYINFEKQIDEIQRL